MNKKITVAGYPPHGPSHKVSASPSFISVSLCSPLNLLYKCCSTYLSYSHQSWSLLDMICCRDIFNPLLSWIESLWWDLFKLTRVLWISCVLDSCPQAGVSWSLCPLLLDPPQVWRSVLTTCRTVESAISQQKASVCSNGGQLDWERGLLGTIVGLCFGRVKGN